MIKNYIKIAWRNLNKHRLFSFINIFGLALGVAAFWIFALYVADEWSYDRYNEKADRVFRVVQHGKWGNGGFDLAITSPPYAPALKADYPEVEDAARIDLEGGGKILVNNTRFEVNDIAFTDNSIFNLFTYHFIAGDSRTALSRPNCIVLTKSLAEKTFGSAEAAINKIVNFDEGKTPNTVTAVIADMPENSTFKASALRSFNTDYTGKWAAADIFTYVLLKHPEDSKRIEASSPAFYNKYLSTAMAGIKYRLELQPLTSIHLYSHLDFEMGNGGNITYVYVFSIVGLLILVIAVINYVNLTTARASVRIKEVGIRKVIGSGKKQLILLFLSESLLLAVLATAMGLVLVQMGLPYFNNLSGKTLSIWQIGTMSSLLLFTGFALLTGLVSGLYPALSLSAFRTIPAMKGQMGDRSSTILFRKALVVFQFVITIVMIIGSWTIYRQINYVMDRDLGFNRSQMVTFHIHSHEARKHVNALKTELLQNPLIESVAAAGNPIGNNDIGSHDFNIGVDGNTAPDTKLVEALTIDEDFIPAMQIKMAQGRNFQKGGADSSDKAIIVNQTLIDELGWKNPIGMKARMGVDHGQLIYGTIVGVVKDFNTYSLQHKIAPLLLTLPDSYNDEDNLYVRLGKGRVKEALAYLQQVYSRFDPDNKIEPHFLDQNFARQYQTEQKQGSLLVIFTVLAIIIACLGLFGLVTFTAEQRVKEISIRKVLGAGVQQIILLLSKDLIVLVVIATLIAAPIAWYGISQWLQHFAYHTSIQWWVFAASGAIAVLIAFATVSYRSVKAALENPAKSLKSE